MLSIPLYPLHKNQFTVIDEADEALVRAYKWHANTQGRVYATIRVNGKNKNFSLHRMLLNAPGGIEVDHINGNPLDNRRSNLRLVTHAQNLQNRHGATRASSSGVRNVYFHLKKQKYQVKLQLGNYQKSFGYYWTLEEAAAVAAEARRKYMPYASE